MKLNIEKVYRKEEISKKTNKPYTRLAIKTKEYPDKWISGFGNKHNSEWKQGDSVDVNVIEKGEYLDFEMINSDTRIDILEQRIKVLEDFVFQNGNTQPVEDDKPF